MDPSGPGFGGDGAFGASGAPGVRVDLDGFGGRAMAAAFGMRGGGGAGCGEVGGARGGFGEVVA